MAEHFPKAEFNVHPLFLGRYNISQKPVSIITVAGTSFRQFALLSLAKKYPEVKSDGFHAQLVVDSKNPFDPKAIAVFAGEDHIGYFPSSILMQLVPDWDSAKKELVEVSRYDCLVRNIKALVHDPAICHALIKMPPVYSAHKPVKNILGVRLSISSILLKGAPTQSGKQVLDQYSNSVLNGKSFTISSSTFSYTDTMNVFNYVYPSMKPKPFTLGPN